MKISILTPAWNEQTHLDEMIRSVIAQTYTNWELVLVDDGSTDATADIMRSWANADARILVASHGRKLGKAEAFNVALRASSGDVICLAGADDTLPANSMQIRRDAMHGTLDVYAVGFFKLRTFSTDPRYDGNILPKGTNGSRSGGSLTITRKAAELIFPIPGSLPSEDIWLGQAVEAVAMTTIDTPKVVLNYRIHPGNTNPRHLPFSRQTERSHQRMVAL